MDLPNSLPSFTAQRSSMKHLVEWKFLALILSEEISDHMYSSSWEYKKDLPKIMQNHCHVSNIKIVVLS